MRPYILAVAVLAVGAPLGCGPIENSTGVGGPSTGSALTIAIAAPPVAGRSSIVNGALVYACDFQLTATFAGGDQGDGVTLDYGIATFRRKSDGQQSTSQLLSADYARIFGANALDKLRASVTGTLSLQSTEPFTVALVTYYSVSGAAAGATDASATTELACN